MAENFLTQDEVDALLNFDSGNKHQPNTQQENETIQQGGVRPYDMANQERIVQGRMPMLEIINARFANMLQIGLYNFLRRAVDISTDSLKITKYSEFTRSLIIPANINIISIKPLRGSALITIDPNLIFLIVDNMFGGDGRFHTRVEGREFTLTEQSIIRRLLDVFFENYEEAWKNLHPIKCEYSRAEMNPQFANIVTPTDMVVASTFELNLGGSRGEFNICIPYSTLEPIRDLLNNIQEENAEVDNNWLKSLTKQVQRAEIEIIAHLGESRVTLHQILNMQKGDVIALDIPDTVVATANGVPVMDCHYGILNNHYALKVKTVRTSTDID
ncbi:flagellar motor switch protein FliM [Nitrosomonas stercoris]|uniref:Flagellar motor switch protein FliM n=1 Tax=Nitrosomonas stercoris TaxID=1444684 RepID=A0A4Y1YNT5_9PROT|nr:flagellar motor switch protein FliM [Nitrosomonas stercoris]